MRADYTIEAVEGAEEPLDLDDAKAFMEVDYNDKDMLISSLITECRAQLELELNRVLVPSVITLDVVTDRAEEPVWIYHYSNPSGLVVTDLDTEETMAADEYTISSKSLSFSYAGRYQLTWTETPKVNQSIIKALKMLVNHRFKYRGDAEKEIEMPESVQRIIDKNAVICL